MKMIVNSKDSEDDRFLLLASKNFIAAVSMSKPSQEPFCAGVKFDFSKFIVKPACLVSVYFPIDKPFRMSQQPECRRLRTSCILFLVHATF